MTRWPLARFFAMAFGFAWLAWLPIVLGRDGLSVVPLRVPASLAFVGTFTGPLLAALLACEAPERRAIVRSTFRVRTPVWIYVTTLVGVPAAVAVTTGLTSADAIPASRWGVYLTGFLPFVVLGSIAGPWGEEPGWRGYALPRLVHRFGPVQGALLLGVVWAAWHLPMALFVPAYHGPVPPWTLFAALVPTVCGLSVFMTWVYYASRRSVFATVVAHAAWNAAVAVQPQLAAMTDRRPSLLSAAALLAALALVASRGRLGVEAATAEEQEVAAN